MSDSKALDLLASDVSQRGNHDELTTRLKAKTREIAASDSLKHTILSMVASQNYEMAKDSFSAYVEDRREFPFFQERANRYVSHGLDLIQAIELKRNFPGLSSLSFAKQQEIHEGVIKHFEELKHTLTSVHKLEREHKLQDLRSTTWFLNTLSYSLFAIISISFALALTQGLGYSFYIVLESLTNNISSQIVDLIGW